MINALDEAQKTLEECLRIANMDNEEYVKMMNSKLVLDGFRYGIGDATAGKLGSLWALIEHAKYCLDMYINRKEETWHSH